jgi:hypothetical protein
MITISFGPSALLMTYSAVRREAGPVSRGDPGTSYEAPVPRATFKGASRPPSSQSCTHQT